MSEIALKTEEAQFNVLKKQSTDIAEQISKLTVTDETTLAITTQNLSKANDIIKRIELIRKDMKEPYFDAGKRIDGLAKSLSNPIENAVNLGKKNILAYNAEKQRQALVETNRILGIKNAIADYSNDAIAEMDACTTMEQLREVRERLIVKHPEEEKWFEFLPNFMLMRETLNSYAKSRKTSIMTPLQADAEEAVTIADVIAETNNNIGLEAIAETVVPKLKGSRSTWKFEVENINNVPLEWLMVDSEAVKSHLKIFKDTMIDGQVINGIKFYLEESLTIR